MNKIKVIFKLSLFTLFFIGTSSAMAQNHQVAGEVRGENGEILPGVNVVLKGTTNGVASDFDGNYSISVNDAQGVLVFSYIGYVNQEIQINGNATISVILEEDQQLLNEVVVIGYGAVKKSDLTGSVASLKADNLEETPASSVDALLQGKIAGVQVTQTSGEPGEGVAVRIRGLSSREGSNSPLYVVDGFPYGDAGNLKQLNPNDIASMEVLKDASAAAIYGSRGANGVIIITTKSGKNNQKAKFKITSQTGVQIVDHDRLNLISDPLTFASISNEVRINDTRNVTPLYIGAVDQSTGVYYPSLVEIANGSWGINTYWPDVILRESVTQNVNLSIAGGDENTAYSVSGNIFDQKGVLIGNDYQNFTFRGKLDQKVSGKFKYGTNLALSYIKRNKTLSGAGIGRSPLIPVYNEDGTYYTNGAGDFYNPVMLANEVTDISNEYDLNALAYIDWDIMENLKLRAQSGINLGHAIGDYYEPRTTSSGNIFNGLGEINNYTGYTFLNETYLTYKKTFNDKHAVSVMGGYSSEQRQVRKSKLRGEGFVNDALGNENLNSATTRIFENSLVKQVLQSFISRITYGFDDRYLLTLSGRYDGSSKFGALDKYGFFPSGAIAWKVHNENFMADQNIVSTLKLRTSFGYSGNQAIDAYATLNQYGQRKYFVGEVLVSGYGPYQNGNPALKWETTSQLDFGLDLGFLNNRITLTADYYRKESTDLLRKKNLPYSSGFDDVWINGGEILNTGYEASIDAAVLTGEFKWNVSGTFSHNENEVVDIGEEGTGDGLRTGSEIESFRDYPTRWRNGEPMNIIVGYKVDGIIQTLAEGQEAGLVGDEAMPGEFKYVDISGPDGVPDGVVNELDRTIIGNTQPDFTIGFNTEFEYKNFDLSAQFYGSIGNDIVAIKKFEGQRSLNRWTVDNRTNEWPSLRGGRLNKISDWWVEDGSFLRISNVTLGYNLPSRAISGIENLRIYVTGTNLHTFTDFSGADPEIEGGVDYGTYPKYKTFTLGLNLTF
ncbi:SusC/RagA family TonB-linked outer membrane protein [Flavivirga spongiicola]|uniref:TonB-dependent receptor n=1 Tax=Flavivirga spongiicola TaxID=421621 RepID=A0ABU7XWC5_9FLAO|nr:TonB-dependent receptor [Flavivirga sp. MEBiC05379]MDO5980081.1 TonB-dependent receptor [Flavivirga sp. MEBiC05379]